MSDYIENGTTFNQGSPQSQVEFAISGTVISMTIDFFIINASTSVSTRGRITAEGLIDLNTGQASTEPTGSPVESPTHGGVTNLANNLAQSFSLDCSTDSDVVVTSNNGIYSYRLTRVS